MALENVNGRQTFFGALPDQNKFGGEIASSGAEKELRFTFDYNDLPAVDAGNEMVAVLPSGAAITSAHLKVKTAMAGTLGTLDIGTYQADGGGVIDLNGIDVAIAQASLTAGAIIVCNGAQVGGGAVAQERAAIVVAGGGTITAGQFELTVRYIV